MPPRKRKAPASGRGGFQPIAESPCKAEATKRDAHGRTKEESIKYIEDAVTERIQMLLATGRELAAAIRVDSQLSCARIPKKVRETSVADFFNLSPEESKQTILTDLSSRLHMLTSAVAGPQEAQWQPEASHPQQQQQQVPSTAAHTTRTERRTAARTGQQEPAPIATATRQRSTRNATAAQANNNSLNGPQQQQQQEQRQLAAVTSMLPSSRGSTPTKAAPSAMQQPQHQQQEGEGPANAENEPQVLPDKPGADERRGLPAGVLRDSTNLEPPGEGLMLPPKRTGRQGGKPAAQGSNQGDAEQAPVAATPHHQGQNTVAATPIGNVSTAMPAGLFASASNLMTSTMRSLPGGASLMAGFTLMKRTVARGRTRRPAEDENAIMISTSDGRQFTVDAGTGLANVPDKYRKEVAAQLEVIQRLAAAALNFKHKG